MDLKLTREWLGQVPSSEPLPEKMITKQYQDLPLFGYSWPSSARSWIYPVLAKGIKPPCETEGDEV